MKKIILFCVLTISFNLFAFEKICDVVVYEVATDVGAKMMAKIATVSGANLTIKQNEENYTFEYTVKDFKIIGIAVESPKTDGLNFVGAMGDMLIVDGQITSCK